MPIHPVSLGKLMLIGAGFALTLILIFLIPAGWFTQMPKPEWQRFWMIRPLVVVPIAGAIGGALFYVLDFLRYRGGWKTAVAYILSIVGFFVIFWLGSVFGLAGTWWD
ncbi:potassium transporter KefB [Adhaeribacter terreus]|uniref:Potassium transporter KefB n=1 Tax=Adhaeribacter terreus TaxID=529703 RepID=A0ABW0E6I7_9BACT